MALRGNASASFNLHRDAIAGQRGVPLSCESGLVELEVCRSTRPSWLLVLDLVAKFFCGQRAQI